MPGTPSIEFGVMIPWKWMAVDSGGWLWRTTLTLSPGLTWIVGAGTVPLKVQASTNLPGATSHFTTLAVSSNCLVPSASTVGCMSCAPSPAVLAGKAFVDASIWASIWSTVMAWLGGVVGAAAGAVPEEPPGSLMWSVAFMPDCSWPGTWQYRV